VRWRVWLDRLLGRMPPLPPARRGHMPEVHQALNRAAVMQAHAQFQERELAELRARYDLNARMWGNGGPDDR
jgi:hypothetical protein